MKKTVLTFILALLAVSAYSAEPVVLGFSEYAPTSSLTKGGTFDNVSMIPLESKIINAELSYMLWQPKYASENFLNAGASYLLGNFAFCFGATYGVQKSYDIMNVNGLAKESFSPSDINISIGAAYKIVDFLSAGVVFHYMQSALAPNYSSSAPAVDVLVSASFGDLKAAAGVRNIGPKVKSASGSEYSIPSAVAAGVSYSTAVASGIEVGAEADLKYYLAGIADAKILANLTWNSMLGLRAGYHLGSDSFVPSYAFAGASFSYSMVKVNLDYLLASDTLGGTLLAGVSVAF